MRTLQLLSALSIITTSQAANTIDADVAGTTLLKNSSTYAIKNKILQDNKLVLVNNTISDQQNDVFIHYESNDEFPADVELLPNEYARLIMPKKNSTSTNPNQVDVKKQSPAIGYIVAPAYRVRFRYKCPRHGLMYGFRYPLQYWRQFGHRFYPEKCSYGKAHFGFYYC